jgi:hypothetical protein
VYNGRNALVKTFRHHGVIGYEIKVQNNQYSAFKLEASLAIAPELLFGGLNFYLCFY